MNEHGPGWGWNDTDEERRQQIAYGRREKQREQGREEERVNGSEQDRGASNPFRVDPATEQVASEAARRADKDIGKWIADAVRETAERERSKATRTPDRRRSRMRRGQGKPEERKK